MRKRIEKEKIKESFEKVKKDIYDLKKNMLTKELHKQLHAVTARTTAQALHTTARDKLKTSEKRLLTRLDSVKLMRAIQSCIDQGYSTNMIRDDIMNRFNIKERCFYNYFKRVREQLHAVSNEQLHAAIKNK